MFLKEVTHFCSEVLCKGMNEALISQKYSIKDWRRGKVVKYSIQGNDKLGQSSRAEREFMWLRREREHFEGNVCCFK